MRSASDLEDLRGRFETKLRRLRGRRILAVDYWDIHNFASDPARWDYGTWHHAVMGVGLTTDAGPVTVTWTSTFYPYGVEVFHDPIEDHLTLGEGGPERVGPHIDSEGTWDRFIGTPIRRTASYWERLELGPSRRVDGTVVGPAYAVDLPTALRLDFRAGAVWFVAAIPQPPEMRRAFVPGDEIMVVFSREKMLDMGFTRPEF